MARVKKYIIDEPATVDEVRKTLKITRADQAVVDRILKELGFLDPPVGGPERAVAKTAPAGSAAKKNRGSSEPRLD